MASSSTSRTATAGSVTAIVGGFANRSSWTPSQTDEPEHERHEQREDDQARRERQARGEAPRSAAGRRSPAAVPGARLARAATAGAPRRGRGRGTARSCAGSPSCRRHRAARGNRHARGRPDTAPGSWCRARRGTGRRPCVRAPRGGVRAGLVPRRWPGRGHRAPNPTARRTWSRVVTRQSRPARAARVRAGPSGSAPPERPFAAQDTPALSTA